MKKWVWRGVQLLLFGVIVWFIYKRLAVPLREIDRAELRQYTPNFLLLLLSLLLLLLVYAMHALLWRNMTAVMGGSPVPLRASMQVFFVSGLGRYVPGKVWQLTAMAILSQRARISAMAASAATVLGQLAFLSTGAIFLALLLPGEYGAISMLGGGLIGVVSGVLFLLSGSERGRAFRHRVLNRFGPKAADAGLLLDRIEARQAGVWWVGYGLSWLALGGGFSVFVTAFDPAFGRHFLYYAGAWAASYIFGLIGPLPGGFGARELMLLTLLSQVIPPSAALLISAASRIWSTAGELLPLAIVPMLPPDAPVETIA